MANSSLYAALASLPNEKEYYANSPWYQSGQNVLGMQVPPQVYKNNTEALLYPFLQGMAGGAMEGYGQYSAIQDALNDTSNIYERATGEAYNPLANALETEDGEKQKWSIKQGQADLLAAVLDAEHKQELDLEDAKQNAVFKNKYSPEAMAAEAKQKAMNAESEAKGKRAGEGPSADLGLSDVALAKIGEQRAIIDESLKTADLIQKSNLNWGQLRAAEQFSGLDELGVQRNIKDIADRLLRIRSGANAPEQEQAKLKKIIAGDFSAGAEQIAAFLRQSAQAEARNVQSKIHTARSLKNGAFESELDSIVKDSPVISNMRNVPTQTIPPGMKLQRNKVTGETRLVPQ